MIAEEKLREGDLAGALEQLQLHVRQDPSNARHRVFLFQLLSVLGRWERALTQLDVVGELDSGTVAMVQTYRDAVRCELLRAEIFAGKRSPLVFGEPDPWIASLIQALAIDAAGSHAEAAEMRAGAFEAAPETPGTLDGAAFDWIADADNRLGPILEAVINGKYYWVPFHRLREIRVEEPTDLRDAVWTPCYVTFTNEGTTVALVPTRYAGSEASDDDAIRLARKTSWTPIHDDSYAGLGQRMLITDAGEHALMDVREIRLQSEGGDERGGD